MSVHPVSAQNILVAAQRLPATGKSYRALAIALADSDASAVSVVDAVRLDGALAARIIRGANSPVFRRGEPSRSLDEAIGRIGLREVGRLAGAMVAERMFADGLPLYHVRGDALWANTVATAHAAEHLALAGQGDARQAYTVGILCQVGRLLIQSLALDMGLPRIPGDGTDPASARLWEQEYLGTTPEDLGARMLRLWGFPAEQEEVLRHVVEPGMHPAQAPECAALHLAGWVAESLGKGLPCEAGLRGLDENILAQARLTETQVQDTVTATREALNRTAAALRG